MGVVIKEMRCFTILNILYNVQCYQLETKTSFSFCTAASFDKVMLKLYNEIFLCHKMWAT